MNIRRLVFKKIPIGRIFVLSFLFLSAGCGTLEPVNTLPLERSELRESRVNAILAEAATVNANSGQTEKEREERWESLVRKAIAEDPDRSASVLLLCDFLVRRQKSAEAWELCREFLSRHPCDTEVLTVATELAFLSRDKEKFGHCLRLLRAMPDPDSQLVRSTALAAFELGLDNDGFSLSKSAVCDNAEKNEFCNEIAEIGTGLLRDQLKPVLENNLAISGVASNEIRRAKSLYDFAVELYGDPGGDSVALASIFRLSASCSAALGDLRGMVDCNHRAFLLADDDYLPLSEIAVALATAKDPELKKHFDSLVDGPERRLERGMVEAYVDFFSGRAARGAARALALYRQLVEDFEIPPVHFFFAVSDMLSRSGRGMESIELLRDAVIRHPESGTAKNNLAFSLSEHNLELDLAGRLAVQALEEEPESPVVLDTMAWVRFKQNRVYEALQLLLKAVSLENDKKSSDPELLWHLRDVLLTTGNEPEARLVEKSLRSRSGRNVETD